MTAGFRQCCKCCVSFSSVCRALGTWLACGGLLVSPSEWYWGAARGQRRCRGGAYLNTFLAFFRVNFQLIFVRFWLAAPFQAAVSRFSMSKLGIRRVPKHCREKRLSSISA